MKKILGIVLFLFVFSCVFSQKNTKSNSKELSADENENLEIAEEFYDDQDYLRALPLFVELMEAYPDDFYFKFKSGVCYLYKNDERDKALDLLKQVKKENSQIPEIDFYLGRAYQVNNKFDDAIFAFNEFLKTNPKKAKRLLAERYIENSENGKAVFGKEVRCKFANLKGSINTENNEYVPVISSDEAVLIYTYRGPRSTGGLMDENFRSDSINGFYYEDIFISHRVGNDWLLAESIGEPINTKGHDANIALSADGQKLFVFHSTSRDGGDIYMSTLTGETWSDPKTLGPNINTKYWEGSCSISSDEQTLYFASERPGGFGGKDIYISKKMPDGSWGVAKNAGPDINTRYNEDSPFIHADGITLFFSSEGHKSIGGYDIMYSTIKDGVWSEPINMGPPINTTDDELFYVLSADGEHGYFSSDRKGGKGAQDIYIVAPGYFSEGPVLALITGNVSNNDEGTDATISVTNAETSETKATYHTNISSGKYVFALPPDNNYKIAIGVEGFQPEVEYVDAKHLDTYVKVQKDYNFYTEKYKEEHNIKIDSTKVLPLQQQINMKIAEHHEEKKPDVHNARVYQDLVTNYGETRTEGVTYCVELGTYQDPSSFNASQFSTMGIMQQRKDSLGTTFYIQGFNTLLNAEIFKYKAIAKDSSLKNKAVVTVNDNGQRKLMREYYANHYQTSPKNQLVSIEPPTTKSLTVNDQNNVTTASSTLKATTPTESTLTTIKSSPLEDTKASLVNPEMPQTIPPDKKETLAVVKKETRRKAEKQQVVTTKKILEYNNPCNPSAPNDFSYFVGKDLNNPAIYNQLIEKAGSNCAEGLLFKVQIGAYRKPQNFKHDNLNSLEPPPAVVTPYPDGISRFTMREFNTLKDAESFRQECIQLGTKDAWIVAFYNGERMFLQELIANNFFNKSIN